MSTDTNLANTVGRELAEELSQAMSRIRHCVEQLSDEQVWQRTSEDRNSIANLLLHLAGNIRQWIIAGVGGAPDRRNRPAEFAHREFIPSEQLLATLQATVDEAKAVLERTTAEEWLRGRRIQGFEETGLGAAIGSVAHFRGHTQEITHIARDLLGERYRFAFVPKTPEQGAPV
jgi:uncharacterized damage-inducible protein DinB